MQGGAIPKDDQNSDSDAAATSGHNPDTEINKIELVVYFKKYLHGLHIFKMSEEECYEFGEQYKGKEILVMHTPVNKSVFLTGKKNI